MKEITKQILLVIVCGSCKLSWHIIALITAIKYNLTIAYLLIAIWVLHQLISLWFVRGREIKTTIERKV